MLQPYSAAKPFGTISEFDPLNKPHPQAVHTPSLCVFETLWRKGGRGDETREKQKEEERLSWGESSRNCRGVCVKAESQSVHIGS